MNKKVLAEFLVKWRLKVFAKHKSLERKIKDKITASFTGRSLPASRTELLDNEILYHLSESVRQNERYTTPIEVVVN